MSKSEFLLFFLLAVSMSSVDAHYHHGRPGHKIVRRRSVTCNPNAIYREADGQCNNLQHQTWGSAGAPLKRLVPAAYDGGSNFSPRSKSVNGSDLPSPRQVSLGYHGYINSLADVSLMVMQWGQFLDHDITLTHVQAVPEGTDCCTSDHSECLPIAMHNDEYFTDRTCMPFIRSQREVDPETGDSVEQQPNSVTAFLDASNVYGSSEEELAELVGLDGQLKDTTFSGKGSYLPAGSPFSCFANDTEYCFLAGDERVNEQPGLGAMHTIFLREHNRIARELKQRNSNWDATKILQETKKIVGAMIQVITYNEFLPIVLGPIFYQSYGLGDDVYEYKPDTNPTISNAFATAAYRFGHSLIPEDITVDGQVFQFKNMFQSPSLVLNKMNKLAISLAKERSRTMDRFFGHSVTRHLFQQSEGTGFDLVALNLQRGRDHGLPSYNTYRQLCHNPPLTSLNQIVSGVNVYSSIDDVDLFTGGVSEPPVPNGMVGPTFACIMGVQFNQLKFGDRFFYLNKVGNQKFTDAQIRELQRVKLSKIVCQNSENRRIQEDIFKPRSLFSNPMRDCKNIPLINLDAWAEEGRKDDGSRQRHRKRGF